MEIATLLVNKFFEVIIKLVPKKVRELIVRPYKEKLQWLNMSYSQEGEDLVLARFFHGVERGFFVDVGAHHPMRFSNTYLFYQKGWRGINIDATPGSMKEFNRIRPHDINLEIPVSDKSQTLTYNMFNDPALNTFSESEASRKNDIPGYEIIEKRELQTQTLGHILDAHLPDNTKINFLSVDVEGMDMAVLGSNDWDKYRPEMVLAEDLRGDIEKALQGELCCFMKQRGYSLVARTYNTLFFKSNLT